MRLMVGLVAAPAAISTVQPVTTHVTRFVCRPTAHSVALIVAYTSVADCGLLAQRGPAQCLANPYFVQRRKSRHYARAIAGLPGCRHSRAEPL
jgi:hypothetical protein